nr:putative reverse transcriptase, RNA-dependent DNA polymerase, Gag-polypeptide of LTR copia-type [Tanacetum cinerariifolium]
MGDNIPSDSTVPSSSSGLNTQDLPDNGSQVQPAARRSSRPSKIPPKFNDYLVGNNVKYGPEKNVSYANLNTSHYYLSTNLDSSSEPNTYYEVVKNTKWIEAMNNEIEAINRNDTWTICDLLKGRKHVASKWSSAEAKYRSMDATCEVIWLSNLLSDMGVKGLLHVVLYCDKSSALQIAPNSVFHEKSKHFEIVVHLVREKVPSGVIKIGKKHTSQQIVDILTKAVDVWKHFILCEKLGLLDMFKVKKLEGVC